MWPAEGLVGRRMCREQVKFDSERRRSGEGGCLGHGEGCLCVLSERKIV